MENKYSFQVAWSDEDKTYFASCPEFPGLLAHGDTPEEAIKEAGIALEGVIEVYKESDLQLPEPLTRQEYSGQFRLRLPKSLHRQAAMMAEREGVSLNAFAATAIAEKVGAEVAKKDAEKVAINIQTVQLASNLTINTQSTGSAITTDMPVDEWGNYQLPTNPCKNQ
jgi:predicted RNase H-like HicB family nuclease